MRNHPNFTSSKSLNKRYFYHLKWKRHQVRAIPSYLVQESVQPMSGLVKWGNSSFYKKSVSLKFLLLFFVTLLLFDPHVDISYLYVFDTFLLALKIIPFSRLNYCTSYEFWKLVRSNQVHLLNFKVVTPTFSSIKSERVAYTVNQILSISA